MGQNASQERLEEKDYDPKDNSIEQGYYPNHETDDPASDNPASDDLVFSGQINTSTNPTFSPPRRPPNIEYSSSPASLSAPSQAPELAPRRKIADLSPHQASPPSSYMGLGTQVDEGSSLPKKKKRSKKRQSTGSYGDKGHSEPFPNPTMDTVAPTDGGEEHQFKEVDGNLDLDIDPDNTPTSAQARSQNKRDKKESRRAAKLARQQAAASSPLDSTQETNRFSEIRDSQEHAIAAKLKPKGEEEPEAHLDLVVSDIAVPQSTAPKKRRRKSHRQSEEAQQRSSKKRKSSQTDFNHIDTEPDVLAYDAATDEPEATNNNDINLQDLAEEFYSGRKRKSISGDVAEPSGLAVEAGQEHGQSMEIVDANGETEGDQAEPNDDVEEVYRDDDIDTDFHDNNGPGTMALEATPTGHRIATRRSSARTNHSNGVTYGTHNGTTAMLGVTLEEATGLEEQHQLVVNTEAALTHVGGTTSPDVEVPSSVPPPGSASESGAKPRTSNKASTGRKRVAKRDFYSRMADDLEENSVSQSPSTAALSRRSDKGRKNQAAVSQNSTQDDPSPANGNARRPKINGMLGQSPEGDSDLAATPSNKVVNRLRTPRTPATLSGAFTDDEIRSLTQAIERFRDDHNMTQYEVNELIHRSPREAGELWPHILAICPDRDRQRVINQVRRKFHNFVARGSWTAEQDVELRQLYEQHGNKYAVIGQLINRFSEDVRDRIRNYIVCGDKQKRDQWSQPETDRLVSIVEQAIGVIQQQRAKRGLDDGRPVEDDISWQLVSQGMDRTRSRLQCIAKWKAIKSRLNGGGVDGETAPIENIIEQARQTAATMSYRNRSLILKEILKTGQRTDGRIPWLKVRNGLGDKWTRTPLMVVWFRLRRSLPDWPSLDVKETCTLLLQGFQQTHKLEYPDDNDLDLDKEYRDIEYGIKKGRRMKFSTKSAAFVSKASGDEDEEEEEEEAEEAEEALRDQREVTSDDAADETKASHGKRSRSIELGSASAGEEELEIEDSEPEKETRRRRRRTRSGGGRLKARKARQVEDEGQSSDTNASQVSSIPAR
ncbi:hypothetical protein F4802DRAFT_526422 [Xylaria palmicola]|nr:hypothetical protein F4802DRAFT_526422 [Xylaria palmicola]